MSEKLPYFGTSTASQRKRLFEVWEETGNISYACRKARLSRTAFYRWYPRFEKEGYAGLEKPLSHAAHNPVKTSEEIASRIENLKRSNPEWGQQRIADELMKSNNWVPVVNASTVWRILKAKGLMPGKTRKRGKKK